MISKPMNAHMTFCDISHAAVSTARGFYAAQFQQMGAVLSHFSAVYQVNFDIISDILQALEAIFHSEFHVRALPKYWAAWVTAELCAKAHVPIHIKDICEVFNIKYPTFKGFRPKLVAIVEEHSLSVWQRREFPPDFVPLVDRSPLYAKMPITFDLNSLKEGDRAHFVGVCVDASFVLAKSGHKATLEISVELPTREVISISCADQVWGQFLPELERKALAGCLAKMRRIFLDLYQSRFFECFCIKGERGVWAGMGLKCKADSVISAAKLFF